MVYNGTSCGLNDCLFAPHFSLPVIQLVLRSLNPGYHSADIDIGEMFLNFTLGEEVRPYSGVDISHIKLRRGDWDKAASAPEWWTSAQPPLEWEDQRTRHWERWCRNWMGLRDSPYRSLQMLLTAKVIAYGRRNDPGNAFGWKEVILNLPGSWDYDSTMPWVYKRTAEGHIASEIYIYVDDGKVTGVDLLRCWYAARQFASVCSRLGIQDASRKRTEPSLTPGPWAGSVLHTRDGLTALVTENQA
jgi:hypothetical protein